MNPKEIILSHFPELESSKIEELLKLTPLYTHWNQKINVISRKDIHNLFINHILHSMLIGKWITFIKETKVLDLGTGGGFPGIPLAILFPEVQFHLIDSKKKKCFVTQEIIQELQLTNASCQQIRGEKIKQSFDFIIARAVAPTDKIISWTKSVIHENHINQVPNGWILLKGGDLRNELKAIPKKYYYEQIPLTQYTDLQFFDNKYIVYIQH